MNELQRWVEAMPAFDRRDPDPKKDYGIHGVELRFYVKGDAGVIQFVLYTNWQLPNVRDEQEARLLTHDFDAIDLKSRRPLPADIGYHSPVPMHEGQSPMGRSCHLIDGGVCYYDGSSLNAERYFDVLVREGTDGLWREMEAYYFDTFRVKEAIS